MGSLLRPLSLSIAASIGLWRQSATMVWGPLQTGNRNVCPELFARLILKRTQLNQAGPTLKGSRQIFFEAALGADRYCGSVQQGHHSRGASTRVALGRGASFHYMTCLKIERLRCLSWVLALGCPSMEDSYCRHSRKLSLTDFLSNRLAVPPPFCVNLLFDSRPLLAVPSVKPNLSTSPSL